MRTIREMLGKRADGTWSDGDGIYRWYVIDPETELITEDIHEICSPQRLQSL